jgi:hypothetical protein
LRPPRRVCASIITIEARIGQIERSKSSTDSETRDIDAIDIRAS